MGRLLTLDRVLERLIFERSYRRAWASGEVALGDLKRDEVAAISSLDHGVLASLAERVARQTVERRHAGSGSLLELYPRCVASWRTRHASASSLLELAFQFQESPAFRAYRELPFSGVGASLEQCFFEFAELESLADPAVREHEFLAAMMRLLAASPRALFRLAPGIRRVQGGFFAVTTRSPPTLYAAVKERYISGVLTPFLVELLAPGGVPQRVAERHGVSRVVLVQCLDQLCALGLLPQSSSDSA